MMRYLGIAIAIFANLSSIALATPASPQYGFSEASNTLGKDKSPEGNTNVSLKLFAELEELSRIVDISYCVGTTGISKPFKCASRCNDFPEFELVDTFNTGPLMSDSCGYIVLDHGKTRVGAGRIIVAFRGTYSITNTIVDLSTVPQEYVPYPDNPDNSKDPQVPSEGHRHRSFLDLIPRPSWLRSKATVENGGIDVLSKPTQTCYNCTVHTGFWTSWQNTRPLILPRVEYLRQKYPEYRIDLVGHSLGGAVAALAGLEFEGMGWHPTVTTFGEPKVGNAGLRNWIDFSFGLPLGHTLSTLGDGERYRRVTHVDDPVPLLPLQEWGYRAHAGEVFISKGSLQPALSDVRICYGDEDVNCIVSAEVDESWFNATAHAMDISEFEGEIEVGVRGQEEEVVLMQKRWGLPIPARYKIWQLFFAHRDYFWRLGLCVPGGDPLDWGRERYDFGDGEGDEAAKMEL
jgi:hypothetical protein